MKFFEYITKEQIHEVFELFNIQQLISNEQIFLNKMEQSIKGLKQLKIKDYKSQFLVKIQD